MSKVKIKNLEAVFAKIKKELSDIEPTLSKEIGDFAVERIRGKARAGKTMAYGEKEQPMKPLSPEYIDFREQLAHDKKNRQREFEGKKTLKRGITSHAHDSEFSQFLRMKGKGEVQTDPTFFSPKKSNLTLSGQYLKSLKLLKATREGKIVIGVEGGRKGDSITNEELAGYLKKQGRSIFGLDTLARKRIKQMVLEYLKRKLAQNRLRKK